VHPSLDEEARNFGFPEDGLKTPQKYYQNVDQEMYSAYGISFWSNP
jgi:hypothetical protein